MLCVLFLALFSHVSVPIMDPNFASQSCVLISNLFFWWTHIVLFWAKPVMRLVTAILRADRGGLQNEHDLMNVQLFCMGGFSVCWNTEYLLFFFICCVHYLCNIDHRALPRAFREVNFARTMTQSFSLLRNFNEWIFVYCVKLLFGNGRK